MKPRYQFLNKFKDCKVSIKMDDGTIFSGTLEDEDWNFLYLSNCQIRLSRGRKLNTRPDVAVRKIFIQNMLIFGEAERGEEQWENR